MAEKFIKKGMVFNPHEKADFNSLGSSFLALGLGRNSLHFQCNS